MLVEWINVEDVFLVLTLFIYWIFKILAQYSYMYVYKILSRIIVYIVFYLFNIVT